MTCPPRAPRYFIEPMAAVKANNELRELASQGEDGDRAHPGRAVSAECAALSGGHLERLLTVLVRLDLIFAKAKLAYRMDAHGRPN